MTDPLARRIASSGLSLVVRRVSVLATTALSTAVIARALRTEDYGRLQACLAVWTIVLSLCEFGFGPALSREFATRPAERPALLRAGRDLQGLLGILGCAGFVAGGIAAGVRTQPGQIYLALAPSVAFAAFNGGRSLFLSLFETRRLVRIDVAVAVAQCVAVVVVAVLTNSPVLVALVTSIAMAVNTGWVGLAAHRRAGRARPAARTYRRLIRHVLALGASSVVSRLYLSIDLVILGAMALDSEVAWYAGAVKIVAFLNTLTGLVVSAALPGLSSVRDDSAAMLALAGRLMSWIGVTVLPCFVVCAVFARPVCELLLGSAFADSAPLVVLLIGAGVVAAASQIFGAVLTGLAVVKPMLYQNLAAVAVNVAGNVLLIPGYGAFAAAWMTILTELIVCGGSVWTLTRRYRLDSVFATITRPVVATVAAAAAGFPLRDQFWLGIPLSVGTFFAFVAILKCWPPELRPGSLGPGQRKPVPAEPIRSHDETVGSRIGD